MPDEREKLSRPAGRPGEREKEIVRQNLADFSKLVPHPHHHHHHYHFIITHTPRPKRNEEFSIAIIVF
jgi:hypothetical protein